MKPALKRGNPETAVDSPSSAEPRNETGRILEKCTDCGACVKACKFLTY
ncbi:MAG: 4Fe-4S binding protein [Proteobacteria bacterium]|nr:4Fe-4S binding protein [Pseudomonadota bacterium]MBU1714648.1 4Fe-4S binding protein [Pseudomonadota bacterium]